MMTDPIADMLTRIRNAVRIERTILDMPASHMRRGIAQVLKDEGYIWDFEEIETVPAKTLRLHMKYGPNGERLIEGLTTVTFADHPQGTLMEMTTSAKALMPQAVAMLGGMEMGWSQSLDKLTRLVEK